MQSDVKTVSSLCVIAGLLHLVYAPKSPQIVENFTGDQNNENLVCHALILYMMHFRFIVLLQV